MTAYSGDKHDSDLWGATASDKLNQLDRTNIRKSWSVIDHRRFALSERRSLQPEEIGDIAVTTAYAPQMVRAWVVWDNGVEELVEAAATAWTKRAVLVRFGISGHMHEVWVGPEPSSEPDCPVRPVEDGRLSECLSVRTYN